MQHDFNSKHKYMTLNQENIVMQTLYSNADDFIVSKAMVAMPKNITTDPIGKLYVDDTKTFTDAPLTIDDVKQKRDEILSTEVDPIVSNALRWEDFTEEKQNEWREYRKALLDITDQEGCPTKVIWPQKPS